MAACDSCLRRTWLLQRLHGYLEFQRKRVEVILSCDDRILLECWLERAERRGWTGDPSAEYEQFDRARAELIREQAAAAGVEQICVCENAYPEQIGRAHV